MASAINTVRRVGIAHRDVVFYLMPRHETTAAYRELIIIITVVHGNIFRD